MALNKYAKTTLFIIGAIVAISFLEWYSFWGILLFILIIGIYRLYTKREMYIAGMENIETSIFGKPLNKDLWDKGEMKETKFEIGFGKGLYNRKMILKLLVIAFVAIALILLWRSLL